MNQQDQNIPYLLDQARFISNKSICPISNVPVGAAIQTDKGFIFVGHNIEISTGFVYCAEQVAVINMINYCSTNHLTTMRVLAIATYINRDDIEEPKRFSCGKCLQILSKFMYMNGVIAIGKVGEFELRELLPFPHK